MIFVDLKNREDFSLSFREPGLNYSICFFIICWINEKQVEKLELTEFEYNLFKIFEAITNIAVKYLLVFDNFKSSLLEP